MVGSEPIEVWCHDCGCLMKLRKGKYGEFWGCTGYPKCFHTLNTRDAAAQHDPSELDLEEAHDLKFLYDPPDGSD